MITKSQIEKIPSHKGVYIFWNGNTPLYIGKAINLKLRIQSHFRNSSIDDKERQIIKKSTKITTTAVLTEFDALLVEASLINHYKPFFNVRSRDDKSYLYIKITVGDKYPKIFSVRRETDKFSLYFGPFESLLTVRKLLRQVRKLFPYCTEKKIRHHGCFYSKIGLCDPCPNLIENIVDQEIKKGEIDRYKSNIKKIITLFKGRSSKVVSEFENSLAETIKNDDFESGITIKKKLFFLKELINSKSFGNYIPVEGSQLDKLKQEITAFLGSVSINKVYSHRPVRFECYDISVLSGRFAAGSMVVFIDGLATKDQYRRFRVIAPKKNADIYMIEEIVNRRLKRTDWHKPDLIVIDGGIPQLRMVRNVLDKLSMNIPLIGLAKRPDRLVDGQSFRPIPLKRGSLIFRLFQEMRDESHRFAKKYHLLMRRKYMESQLNK